MLVGWATPRTERPLNCKRNVSERAELSSGERNSVVVLNLTIKLSVVVGPSLVFGISEGDVDGRMCLEISVRI
jgi:hypothetical protein